MKNQVTTVYKQAERFAEITKMAVITGNITKKKNAWLWRSGYFPLGATKQKMPFRMCMFFRFPLLWNYVIAIFAIFFQNR
jgi:hypothetical protein